MQNKSSIFIVSLCCKQILLNLDVSLDLCNQKWSFGASRKQRLRQKVNHRNQNSHIAQSLEGSSVVILHGTKALWRKLPSNTVNKQVLASLFAASCLQIPFSLDKRAIVLVMSGNYFVSLLGRQRKVCATKHSWVKILWLKRKSRMENIERAADSISLSRKNGNTCMHQESCLWYLDINRLHSTIFGVMCEYLLVLASHSWRIPNNFVPFCRSSRNTHSLNSFKDSLFPL